MMGTVTQNRKNVKQSILEYDIIMNLGLWRFLIEM